MNKIHTAEPASQPENSIPEREWAQRKADILRKELRDLAKDEAETRRELTELEQTYHLNAA